MKQVTKPTFLINRPPGDSYKTLLVMRYLPVIKYTSTALVSSIFIFIDLISNKLTDKKQCYKLFSLVGKKAC